MCPTIEALPKVDSILFCPQGSAARAGNEGPSMKNEGEVLAMKDEVRGEGK
jgi:hypothetical protein